MNGLDEFSPTVRRIVTGHDDDGSSYIEQDGPARKQPRKDARALATTVWATRGRPDYLSPCDGADLATGLPPPANGTRFGVLDLAPGREAAALHRTDTLDYVICVWGEVTLKLDREEIVLRAGDTVVQRGTAHAWCNRGDRPARIAFVLIDADPARGAIADGSPAHQSSPPEGKAK